jgi:hypothetical protein
MGVLPGRVCGERRVGDEGWAWRGRARRGSEPVQTLNSGAPERQSG